MRKAAVVKGLKNSQKLRVFIDGVGFYMTVDETQSRFAQAAHYGIVYAALIKLVEGKHQGIAETVYAYDYKMNKVAVQVQVDLL